MNEDIHMRYYHHKLARMPADVDEKLLHHQNNKKNLVLSFFNQHNISFVSTADIMRHHKQ